MKPVFMLFTNDNTQFGPYSTEEAAKDAKANLAKYGDSLGIKWPKNSTKLVECYEWQDLKGMITYKPVDKLRKYAS